LIGFSVLDNLALFTSGQQKQHGFPFRSGYRRANFGAKKRSCGFVKHEEGFKVLFKSV
jgi:hypothetical protein